MEHRIRLGHMAAATDVMAVLANLRDLSFKKLSMTAAVGFVARQAVLLHGWVLPHERAPLFSVTFIAQFIDCVSLDQFVAEPPVDIVTTGALNETFLDGMVGLFVELQPNVLVA